MTPILALAGQYVRAAIRDRVLFTVPFVLVVLLSLSPLVADLALGGSTKAVRDVGLSFVWLVASAVGIWLGVRAIGTDLRDGTVVLWVSRPLSRGTYVTARFLGVLLVLTVEVALLAGAWALVAALNGALPDAGLLWWAVLLWVEVALVAAWALFLSSFASPVPAALCTAALWAAGHLSDEYARFVDSSDGAAWAPLYRLLYVVVPDLDLFDVQDKVVHDLAPDGLAAAWACAYGVAWMAALVAGTGLVISRRDLA